MKNSAMRMRFLAFLFLLALPASAQTSAERARAEQAAGNFATAGMHWRQVLETQPDNTEALGGFCDSMGALGRWRECVPYLEKLVALQPNNAQRMWDLGMMKSWLGAEERARGIELMRRALEMLPENADRRTAYATALTWDAATREQGIAQLREILTKYIGQDSARRSLARALMWQGKSGEALVAAQPLVSRARPTTEDLLLLAELQAAAGNHAGQLDAYRRALATDPDNVELILRIAPILSWDAKTRNEAAQYYERAIRLQPDNTMLLTMYAEMLSWSGATRARSVAMFDQLLAKDARYTRARIGKAQALAWSGRTDDAIIEYNRILAQEPQNVTALRGKAVILMWRAQPSEARSLLLRAQSIAPADVQNQMELARANLAVRRFDEARSVASSIPQQPGEDWGYLQRDIHQGIGTYMELGYAYRHSTGRDDFHRLWVAVSTPIGAGHRLTARFRPTRYDNKPGLFDSAYYSLALDMRLSDTAALLAEVGGETFPGTTGAPASVDGAIEVRFRLTPNLRMFTGFRRAGVDETRTSASGVLFGGVFVGQVRSNLGTVNATYVFNRPRVDISATYSDGVFTGNNVDSNRRQAVDFGVGKILKSYKPFLRVGGGTSAVHFQHDMSAQPGFGPPRRTGGYFSPDWALFNYGTVGLSYPITRKLEWGVGGNAGVSTARTTPASPWDTRFASFFTTSLTWNANDHNTLRISYDHIDVFRAYRYNLVTFSWRYYFF